MPKDQSANTHRIGKFRVSTYLIRHEPASALAVLENCIVVRAENSYETDAIEYVALSADFDPVPLYSLAPSYDAIISGGKREWRRSDQP